MSVAIYVEGGGDGKDGKALLRQGFDALLAPQKCAARLRRCEWRLTMCGPGDEACRAFLAAIEQRRAAITALLVDAEGPVQDRSPTGRVDHLRQRGRWQLDRAAPNAVHLMVECMETWLVADPNALQKVYGNGFHDASLPARLDLDDHPKADVMRALAAAVRETRRGSYAKIRDASAVLLRIDPEQVARRCPSFRAFRDWLSTAIGAC